ncbi:hypothetical protein [Marinoscillum furvescens]|uniref:Uncharacterized protein n=1 Tax=Marinoscillum furvescens DSM 4134 TaxID=1122208 RepID=A0A3D9L9X0_MARFU|nr:hypothetical protein [Marinoscillum furvescens]REE02053.1 hypothetical protein C7460_10273 [Marinoscillum furvescens DSM 4134]
MSIFPKRALPGQTVTIHWNFNISHLSDVHICPWVRIGVKSPTGHVTMLFEGHVLGIPTPANAPDKPSNQLKYLNKNLPLLIIAEYLSGQHSPEKLAGILQNIQSGRHYYFPYTLPDDAPLGRYTLVSEVYNGGEVRHSKTAQDDFFFVENVSLKDIHTSPEGKIATVVNHSPEPTPVKIVACSYLKREQLETDVQVFELAGFEEKKILLLKPYNYLLYNEERKVVPLQESAKCFVRNQQVSQLLKQNGDMFLLNGNKDGYRLTAAAAELWKKADGMLTDSHLSDPQLKVLEELQAEGLIQELKL